MFSGWRKTYSSGVGCAGTGCVYYPAHLSGNQPSPITSLDYDFSSSISIFDTSGGAHDLSIYYDHTSSNLQKEFLITSNPLEDMRPASLGPTKGAGALLLPFLPAYAIDPAQKPETQTSGGGSQKLPVALTLATIFLFQAANMGLFAFIIGLGEFYKLELDFISTTLGIANWLGLAGAGLVIAIGSRFGYLRPVLAGIAFTALAIWVLLYSNVPWIWIASNCLIGITWGFTISYLLGLASRFDVTGQMAAMGGFASKMGLASGPVVTAMLLGEDNYELIIIFASVVMVISAITVWGPARLQDRSNATDLLVGQKDVP